MYSFKNLIASKPEKTQATWSQLPEKKRKAKKRAEKQARKKNR